MWLARSGVGGGSRFAVGSDAVWPPPGVVGLPSVLRPMIACVVLPTPCGGAVGTISLLLGVGRGKPCMCRCGGEGLVASQKVLFAVGQAPGVFVENWCPGNSGRG